MRIVWKANDADREKVNEISRELNISPIIAKIMVNRGIENSMEAKTFISGESCLAVSPFLLVDMERAVNRIQKAIKEQEKIIIYGDYDVDGVTATSLLCLVLREFGANVNYYIPERQSEGYGLNIHALEHLVNKGAKLIFTVDCGISAVAEIARISGKVDVIVTDHHEPPSELPPAYAIINPKRVDCSYPFKLLAGVGVAFRFCQALFESMGRNENELRKYLDIVAIGTVADMVPLVKENRDIVRAGLEQLTKTQNKGLKALLALLKIDGEIETSKISFAIAPRINAVGRMSKALAGVQLFLTDDDEEATQIVEQLELENQKRQTMEKEIFNKAVEQIEEKRLFDANVIVVAGEDWHQGVIGIVASKLLNKYHRPIVMISLKDGIGKGSCRSVVNFDIYKALSKCQDILISFGGHQQAAGLKLKQDNIAELLARLNRLAEEVLISEDYLPSINVDVCVSAKTVTSEFVESMRILAPFGMGNPKPIIACDDFILRDFRFMGMEKNHLKLQVMNENILYDVLAWDMADESRFLISDGKITLAFTPEYNEWQGKKNLQLKAYDFVSNDIIATLDRGLLVCVYSVVKKLSGDKEKFLWSPEAVLQELVKVYVKKTPVGVLNLAMEILTELELVSFLQKADKYYCCLLSSKEKKDLYKSKIYKNIQRFKSEFEREFQ